MGIRVVHAEFKSSAGLFHFCLPTLRILMGISVVQVAQNGLLEKGRFNRSSGQLRFWLLTFADSDGD